jgi:hypothetical protein
VASLQPSDLGSTKVQIAEPVRFDDRAGRVVLCASDPAFAPAGRSVRLVPEIAEAVHSGANDGASYADLQVLAPFVLMPQRMLCVTSTVAQGPTPLRSLVPRSR